MAASTNSPNSGQINELESARLINDYLNHYVTVTDGKALGLLAGVFASAAFLLKDIPCVSSWVFWGYCIAVLFHLLTAAGGLITIYPRVPSIGSSVIFWEDINRYSSLTDYLKAFKKCCSSSFLDEEYATQNYYVSKVLHRKTSAVRWTIRMFIPALLIALFIYSFIPHPE